MKRILCIRSDRFGEFLCSLPAIKLVRINYPQSIIYLLAQKSQIELVKGVDFIDYFFEYKEDMFCGYRGAVRLAKILRRENIDSVIILNPKKEFHLAPFLAGVPLRLGYDRKWGFLLNKKIGDKHCLELRHEKERNVDLVSLICERVFTPQVELSVEDKTKLEFLKDKVDLRKKYIILHPFTSHPLKEIEKDFWERLLSELKVHLPQEIVMVGDVEDKTKADVYKDKCQVKDLVGRMNLRELAVFIKHNCFIFIGVDSGPMHLASLLNVPVVGLFKTSSPLRWGPWSKETIVIKGNTTIDFIGEIEKIVSFADGPWTHRPKTKDF